MDEWVGKENSENVEEVIILISTTAPRFAVISGSNKAKANFDKLQKGEWPNILYQFQGYVIPFY